MIGNIKRLTKMFTYNHLESMNLRTKKGKINFKSINLLLLIMIMLILALLSQTAIKFLAKYGVEDIFLEIEIILLVLVVLFQAIMTLMSLVFFSDDTVKYLPMPITMRELLVSKYLATLIVIYMLEGVLVLFPTFIYLTYAYASMLAYVSAIVVLTLLPIIVLNVTLVINFVLIKLIKYFKSKKVYQLIMTTLFMSLFAAALIGVISSLQSSGIENINDILTAINSKLVITELLSDMVVNPNVSKVIMLLLGSMVTFVISIGICERSYLKNLLVINKYNKRKTKKINLEKKIRCKNMYVSYIKNDIRNLVRSSENFLQMIYPVVLSQICIVISGVTILTKVLANDLEARENIAQMGFNVQGFASILGIIILLNSFTMISLTAISRMGNEASKIKCIPISFKKQFVLKNIPQIILNTLNVIIIATFASVIFESINWYYTLILGIGGMLINIINSNIMLIVDSKRPNLIWENASDLTKQNQNKLFQYGTMIVLILILMYTASILIDMEVGTMLSIGIILLVEVIGLVVINLTLNYLIQKEKLFNKIGK